MPLRPILRLLLAGLLAGSALLAPAPGGESDTPPLRMGYQVAHADPGDWPMYRYDLTHTGYNPSESAVKPPLRLKWSYATGGAVYSSPAVVNGVVYVGSRDPRVYALDAATGAVRWSYTRPSGALFSSPTVANGMVYVGGGDKVYALDAATGAFNWSYSTGGLVGRSPAVTNGTVYVGSGEDRKVYALDAATGAFRWSYTTTWPVDSSPAVANGMVYVGDEQSLYALDAATGVFNWSYSTGWLPDHCPAVTNGVVYVGSGAPHYKLFALDATTGALRWSYTTGRNVGACPALANGIVYAGSMDNKVYGLDASSGALNWSYATGGGVNSSPAAANGVVYVGSYDNKVYGLDASTGALKWSYTTGGSIFSSLAVANGVVYVGSGDGKVYAFEGEPPPVALGVALYQVTVPFPLSWTVPITWTGTTAASYDAQYRDGPSSSWTDLITATTALSTTFTGQDGHTYGFRARSRTTTGSLADWSEAVSTTVDLTSPVGSLSIEGGATYGNAITATVALSATDTTSGVAGVSFSNDGNAWSNWDTYASTKPWPLASGPDGPRTAYARFRDTAQNISSIYSDTIVLDTAAPTGTVAINGGASDTNSTAVTLALAAGDALSGMGQMSFSNDGVSYSLWEDYATTKSWSIPGGNGAKTVYARFRDNAGNVSQPYTDTIILNTILPSSAVSPLSLYQSTAAFTVSWSGTALGSGAVAAYDLQYKDGAAGPWTDWITGTLSTSTIFTGTEGHTYYFQSRARDLAGNVEPYPGGDGHTRTTVDLTPPSGGISINGGALDTPSTSVTLVLSATDSLSGVSQASYSDDGSSWSTWESFAPARSWNLPSGDGDKTVWARFRDVASNVSSPVSDTIRLDTTVRSAYGLSVNDGALFTNQVTVTLSLPANPNTADMMLSNDGGFAAADWQPYSAYRAWAITQYGSYVIPRTVYAKYRDVNGNVSANYQDDIILDLNAPSGSVSIEGAGGAGGQGQGSRVQAPMPHASAWSGDGISPAVATTSWSWPPAGGGAPRLEAVATGNGATPPAEAEGLASPGRQPLAPDFSPAKAAAATAVTLRLSASDDVSGVGGMMVSSSPAFSGASWEPFSATKSWSMESGGKVYVAFKDNAGNASPIYAASLSGAKESLPSMALGTVHPKTGGQIASAEAKTTVAFPPGAVAAKAEVTLVPAVESNLQASTGALKSTGKFLTLTAKAGETSLTSVSKPYTITVSYAAGDVAGMDESTLGIYWWNGSAWQKEPSSRVDTAARTVSATLDHLSAFAVLGESSVRKVYLPLVSVAVSGW